ncbi:hypothetical protein RUMCAL_00878 [Ruminococcus callidus ATCC 27760]|uniref:Uncharacterized protein n=1 Tax=Ruminococcus callidus ATCC 27760 TaxID=411473 RepID=U2KDZ0_9FIRM|nr:hypothetical protein RUMCAL_00878 [Ruminococcus callidus ATCC 27760]
MNCRRKSLFSPKVTLSICAIMTKIPFCSSPAKAFLCENEHILKKNSTKNFSPAFHDLESGFTQTLLTEINFQKYVDLNCVKL